MGFSMGGHGALTIGLAYAEQYKCISAFAPVCTPASSVVGDIYFSAALGSDKEVSNWCPVDCCRPGALTTSSLVTWLSQLDLQKQAA